MYVLNQIAEKTSSEEDAIYYYCDSDPDVLLVCPLGRVAYL